MTYVFCLHFELDDDDPDVTDLSQRVFLDTVSVLPTFDNSEVIFDEDDYDANGSFATMNTVNLSAPLAVNDHAILYIPSAATVTAIRSIFDDVDFIAGFTHVENAFQFLETADSTSISFDVYHLQNLATEAGALQLTLVVEESNT